MEITGRLVDASNATLFGTVSADGVALKCVYKPVRGERPLWDFPDGTLAGREVATFLISEAAGFDVVPHTLLRDGPFGPGMVQVWVETDDERELVDVCEPADVPRRLDRGAAGPWGARRARRCWCTPTRPRCAGWPRSTWWSTTPTARAGTCWPASTGTCTASTTG